jgi:hypothetical protein
MTGEIHAPVFVLSGARSGSTLVRYILDAHADLACPEETTIPHACLQLAGVWGAILGTPLPSGPSVNVAAIPDPVIAEVRRVVDSMIESYLARRGKRRFCEKSIGAAMFADLLMRLYPDAKFICLVRHSMDFIKSALDASPWGLLSFGFDKYATAGAGNMVCSLGQYWIDHTNEIMKVARRYPQDSYILRYEDLVNAPERVAGNVFAFLGVTQQPGISHQCLDARRERLGAGDHKLWWTSEISTKPVGQGQVVPPRLLTPQVRHRMNMLLSQLSYLLVERDWGTADGPTDPRVPGSGPPDEHRSPAQAGPAAGGMTLSLEKRLRHGISNIDARFTDRWQPCSGDTFACVSRPRTAARETRWLIDLTRRTIRKAGSSDYQWGLVGQADAWEAVLSGRSDLTTSVRHGELRYCEGKAAGSEATVLLPEVGVAGQRLEMVGDLLGLTPWLSSQLAG